MQRKQKGGRIVSKNKDLKRGRRVPVLVQPAPATPQITQPSEAKRAAFTLTLTFDPARPEQVKYDVLSVGDGVPRDGDILDALQMTRDDILVNSAVALTRQHIAAQAQAQMPPPTTADSVPSAIPT